MLQSVRSQRLVLEFWLFEAGGGCLRGEDLVKWMIDNEYLGSERTVVSLNRHLVGLHEVLVCDAGVGQ